MQTNEHREYRRQYKKTDTENVRNRVRMPHSKPENADEVVREPLDEMQTDALGSGDGGIGEDNTDMQPGEANETADTQPGGGVGFNGSDDTPNEAHGEDTTTQPGDGVKHNGGEDVPGGQADASATEAQGSGYADGETEDALEDADAQTEPSASEASEETPAVAGGGYKPLYIEPDLFRIGIRILECHKDDVGAIGLPYWSYINEKAEAAVEYRELGTEIYKILMRIRDLAELDVGLLNSVVDAFEAIDNQ